jgi:hypothetical protein
MDAIGRIGFEFLPRGLWFMVGRQSCQDWFEQWGKIHSVKDCSLSEDSVDKPRAQMSNVEIPQP